MRAADEPDAAEALAGLSLAELWRLFPIRLREHDPAWAAQYAGAVERLAVLLGPRLVCVSHIGSTAVPGLAAEYAVLKRRLAREFEHDRDAYTAAKGEFIAAATARARARYGPRHAPRSRFADDAG